MLEEPQLPSAYQEAVKQQAVQENDPAQENVPLKPHFQDYLDFEADCSGIFDSMDTKTAKQIIQKIQP